MSEVATSLRLYDATARAAAAQVLARYSTSFSLGTRLLDAPMRQHIEAVYAMVRIGDEIVDTYRGADAAAVLDGFEAEVSRTMEGRFSANLVAHAFGLTAAQVGITSELTGPFFASMRMDLHRREHDDSSLADYIHGSAEVVGEMCVRVFLFTHTGPGSLDPALAASARRLGAAYQKVNFLRDISDDAQLGRTYFPDVTAATITDEQLAALIAQCRADIARAGTALSQLPRRPAVAVRTTIDIYTRLLNAIEATGAAALATRRVRVGNARKAGLALRAMVVGPGQGRSRP